MRNYLNELNSRLEMQKKVSLKANEQKLPNPESRTRLKKNERVLKVVKHKVYQRALNGSSFQKEKGEKMGQFVFVFVFFRRNNIFSNVVMRNSLLI